MVADATTTVEYNKKIKYIIHFQYGGKRLIDDNVNYESVGKNPKRPFHKDQNLALLSRRQHSRTVSTRVVFCWAETMCRPYYFWFWFFLNSFKKLRTSNRSCWVYSRNRSSVREGELMLTDGNTPIRGNFVTQIKRFAIYRLVARWISNMLIFTT